MLNFSAKGIIFMYHHIWAEINLNALSFNIKQILKLVPAKKVMGVIKANAYGHGAAEVLNTLLSFGIENFAVSNVFEALDLRTKQKNAEILILGYCDSSAVLELAKNNITASVFDLEYAKSLNAAAKNAGVTLNCHIKINSGMNRLGFAADDLNLLKSSMQSIFALENLNVTGAFTHFATADRDGDDNGEFTTKQYKSFLAAKDVISDVAALSGKKNLCFHSSNSAATLLDNSSLPSDLYRAGIILYGLTPSVGLELPFKPQPVMSLKAVVSQVKALKKGDSVSYGRTFTASKDMRVATITAGYADGYMRGLSGKGYVLINGKKANILGRVCMDQTVVDVTDIADVKTGNVVTLFGEGLPVEELAKILGTINYELVCAVAHRVPRIYIKDGEVTSENRYISL